MDWPNDAQWSNQQYKITSEVHNNKIMLSGSVIVFKVSVVVDVSTSACRCRHAAPLVHVPVQPGGVRGRSLPTLARGRHRRLPRQGRGAVSGN